MDNNKLNRSNKVKIIVIALLVFLVAIAGITYAYFSIQIVGNDTASSLRLTSADLKLVYTDMQILANGEIEPGWSQTKTITVENQGTKTVYYNLIWRELLNEIINDELTISMTCTSDRSGNTCPSFEKAIPTKTTEATNVRIKNNISIDAGETHTYTVTITFIETNSLQNYNQGKQVRGTLNISEGAEEHPLYNVMKTLAEEGTYASTYSGTDTNDSYGVAARKTVYYIRTKTFSDASTLLSKINVKFAGYCWQILRTTDTGGVKLIYNGEYVNGTGCKAQDTTDTHKGIIGTDGTSGSMIGDYMYSDTFTYNTSTNQFTLVNPTVSNWSTNKNLVGKYTCKTSSSTSTCTTLYYLNMKHRTTADNAWYTTYTIGDTQNAQIGTSPINANGTSPAYVGYMFGDTAYEFVTQSSPTNRSKMGNDVYWNGSNYVLKDGDNDSTYTYSGSQNANYHYTCNTTSATCTDGKVRYYYYNNYYIELTGGDKVEDAISKMLTNVENKHDSAMKTYLENWYYNNLKDFEEYIDQDAVYCNDRSIGSLGGWSKTGPLTTNDTSYLKFNNYHNYYAVTTLGCANNTDKFSTSNTSAQLKYPIGLATAPEMNLINNSNVRKTGKYIWFVSPSYFYGNVASEYLLPSDGIRSYNAVRYTQGGRPVITLVPSNTSITGDGSLSNPYVIE